jgi:diaminohydroxyphosphoribosylaminopyrimidine deaminase/5-amino-6-(5-phosphoribosylamino)uracil reductase
MSLQDAQATPVTAADDARFMQLALALGRRGLGNTSPNPAVGAVIVKDGVILARGWTQEGGRPHAEVEALRRAKKTAPNALVGATLYVTLEPCSHKGKSPPCADAIIKAGIARVVSTLDDPNPEVAGKGHAMLRAKGIAVDIGVGSEEARRAHAGHILRVTQDRPHVLLKLAISADGKVGLAGRKPAAITGEAAVLSDNPQLTCRLPGMDARSPVRVVLDAQLRVPLATSVVATVRETPTWVFASRKASSMAEEVLRHKGCKVFRVDDDGNGRLDLGAVLKVLAGDGVTRLMVEGGPTLAASLVAADLVDEAALIYSEKLIGDGGIAPLEGMTLDALNGHLRVAGSERLGVDTLENYERT